MKEKRPYKIKNVTPGDLLRVSVDVDTNFYCPWLDEAKTTMSCGSCFFFSEGDMPCFQYKEAHPDAILERTALVIESGEKFVSLLIDRCVYFVERVTMYTENYKKINRRKRRA